MGGNGTLFIGVEAVRTAAGAVKVTVDYIRNAACKVDRANPSAPIVDCPRKYSVRRSLPASAFTYGDVLGAASLTATVEGKRLTAEWVGQGEVRRQVNENGALLIEARDALGRVTWGGRSYRDKAGGEPESGLFHRVTAA